MRALIAALALASAQAVAPPAAAEVPLPRFNATAERVRADDPPAFVTDAQPWQDYVAAPENKALAVSRDGAVWMPAFSAARRGLTPQEAIRRALETCEYIANAPCALYAVNARIANVDASDLPKPGRALLRWQGELKTEDIPFVSNMARRRQGGEYLKQEGPKALAVNALAATMSWSLGATDKAASESALANCNTQTERKDCAIYAIGDTIALTPWNGNDIQRANGPPLYEGR